MILSSTHISTVLKDKKLHEDCFRCSTCGCSLKNLGYYSVSDKLYCGIHASQAAQATHSPNRIIIPNSTTIRPKDSKPTSPAFQIPIKPAGFASPPQPSVKSPGISIPVCSDVNLSPKISTQPINYSTNASSTTVKNYNSNLYQSVPHPYPGPGANTYNKQMTTSSECLPEIDQIMMMM